MLFKLKDRQECDFDSDNNIKLNSNFNLKKILFN